MEENESLSGAFKDIGAAIAARIAMGWSDADIEEEIVGKGLMSAENAHNVVPTTRKMLAAYAVTSATSGVPGASATEPRNLEMSRGNQTRDKGKRTMILGLIWLTLGGVVTWISYSAVAGTPGGGMYTVCYGAMGLGALYFLWGLGEWLSGRFGPQLAAEPPLVTRHPVGSNQLPEAFKWIEAHPRVPFQGAIAQWRESFSAIGWLEPLGRKTLFAIDRVVPTLRTAYERPICVTYANVPGSHIRAARYNEQDLTSNLTGLVATPDRLFIVEPQHGSVAVIPYAEIVATEAFPRAEWEKRYEIRTQKGWNAEIVIVFVPDTASRDETIIDAYFARVSPSVG